MGSYVQAYTLYNSVRPFGISAIIGGWDSEAELPVDGQVGSGPNTGSGGKVSGKEREGGPVLYMIEPSGLYWVCLCSQNIDRIVAYAHHHRVTTVQQQAKDARQPRASSKK